MNTPETEEMFQLYRMNAAMPWDLEPLVAAIEIRRDEAEKQLRELVTACNEYGGGASVSHPRYTRQLSAAKKFLENVLGHPAARRKPEFNKAAYRRRMRRLVLLRYSW